MKKLVVCVFAVTLLFGIVGVVRPQQALALSLTVSSLDVPQDIPDNDPTGITSALTAPDLIITDVNLIFNELIHTSVPDLHVELTSPSNTTVAILKAFTENGILVGLETPDHFVGTILDDDAPTNLRDGGAPFTGAFNVEHTSVVANPLSVFDGENAYGVWTLFVSDLAHDDDGMLNGWGLGFTYESAVVPEPSTVVLFGFGMVGLLVLGKKKFKK